MNNSDMRKFLNLIESNNLESDKSFLEECMDDDAKTWYINATNTMVSRIRGGEYPIDVINELAREYSWTNAGSYESFAFARDALDRRAWEMGLRYTDEVDIRNNMDTQSYHDTIITPQVTESEDDPVFEEMINEAGLLSKIIDRIAPGYTSKLESNAEFKKLAKNAYNDFSRRFSFGDGRNMTLANAVKHLKQADIHPAFVDKVTKEFLRKFPQAKAETFDKRTAQAFFIAIAAEIMLEGGKYAVSVDEYKPEVGDDTLNKKPEDINKDTDNTDNTNVNNKKLLKIKTVDDALTLAQKAMSGDISFSPEELHDIGLLLQRYAIPSINAKKAAGRDRGPALRGPVRDRNRT